MRVVPVLTAPISKPRFEPLRNDDCTPGESRGRKATGPRLLRDAALRPDATKDLKTAELRNSQLWRLCFFADQAFDRRDAQTSKQA